ncbi:MAG: hypothetical protein C3F02_01820 [Parcubacteria group bacterium]|nr:MAG: hypothetical protein C3F02_01820 [Parcubacteria group bacterium]
MNRVLISAAGRGTRMLHLSSDRPKHLIEVAGHPFLYYLLNNLKIAGFTEVIMVVGYKKELMKQFLKNYQGQFKITVINQFEKLGEGEYGTACPLKCVSDILAGENFLSIYGDNLYSVEDLRNFNIQDNYNYVAGLRHSEPQNYGVLEVGANGFLKGIIEKPKKPPSNLINTGLYKFTGEVFDYLSKIKLSPRGEYELTDIVDLLAKQGNVKVRGLSGGWLDFGRPEDIVRVENYVRQYA